MNDHPLTKLSSGAELYVQENEPTETPNPAPDGDGGIWYPTTVGYTGLTGDVEWNTGVSGSFSYGSGFAVDDGKVMFGTDVDISSGEFYALSLNDGSVEWSYTPDDKVESTPVVVDGVVYFGDSSGELYALNASDGSQVWKTTAGANIVRRLSYSDGFIVFGDTSGRLYAYNQDGTEEWFADMSDIPESGTRIVNGNVYVGVTGGDFYSFNLSDGSQNWKYTAGDDIESQIAVKDGLVFFGSRDNNVYAVSESDGTEQWSYTTGSILRGIGIYEDGGSVIASSLDNNVYSLNISDGAENWSTTLNDSANYLSVANGRIAVGSGGTEFYGLSAIDGSINHTITVDQSVRTYPLISDGLVFAGTLADTVYAFSATTEPTGYGKPRLSTGVNWVTQQ